MTPAQLHQINQVRERIRRMKLGGADDKFIAADLRREGWAEAAIQAAMEAEGGGCIPNNIDQREEMK